MDINPANPAATSSYITGRKRYARPQGMLWCDNSGTIVNGVRVPSGLEKEDFIICSDHNRGEMSIGQQRIETRQRMINGTMRSYHVADKISLSVSWDRLPSRSYSRNVNFDSSGKPVMSVGDTEYTADGGAGGVELLDWYENHSGPFYVYLAYDKYNNDTFKVAAQTTDQSFNYLSVYNDVRLMYFASFEYSIEKRGGTNYDMWNVSVSLEEV
jgi:hypothetical protein